MKLILDGHTYKYELESLANMFFHENKVHVVYEKHVGEEDFLYTFQSVLPDGKISFKVASRIDGKLREQTLQKAPSGKDTDRFCEYHLCRMLYLQLEEATGVSLAWNADRRAPSPADLPLSGTGDERRADSVAPE